MFRNEFNFMVQGFWSLYIMTYHKSSLFIAAIVYIVSYKEIGIGGVKKEGRGNCDQAGKINESINKRKKKNHP